MKKEETKLFIRWCACDKTKGSSARTFVRDGTPFFSFIVKP